MSSQVTILSGAFTSDPSKYQWLLKTAEKFGVPPIQMFGHGRHHPGDAKVIPEIITHLRSIHTKYVLCTDAYDTMFCRWDEHELILRIEDASGLLISTETECYPPGPWCDVYGGRAAINGGQFCGTVPRVIGLLREMERYDHIGNCQERLHRIYGTGYPMKLDALREVFYSMSGGQGDRAEEYLSETMMLHFNGRTPGIEGWAAKVLDA